MAKLAGFSTATISRAINNPEAVQEKTREKINAVLEETGYSVPSRRRSASNEIILFLFNEDDYLFYDRIYSGFQFTLRDTPYNVVMCPIPADESLRKNMLLSFSRKKVSSVIYALRDFFPVEVGWFRNNGIPVVLARKYPEAGLELPRCYIDFSIGSLRMTNHLLSVGYRKIFLLVEKASFQFVESLCAGWKHAFFASDLPFSDDWIIHTKNSVQGGYEKAAELLSSSQVPDALFCASNEMALGVLRAARDFSVPVPDKLAVVGFTDSPTATCTEPELTTLHQPIEQLGIMITDMLLKCMKYRGKLPACPPEIVLQPQLCIRGSCRA